MPDVVDVKTRSRMMAGIRDRDTIPETLIRKALHRIGYRYRLHDKNLPGKPDIILPKYNAIIHVLGCFWHGHDCHLFKWPSTRRKFWKAKIERNRERDKEVIEALADRGWRQLFIRECALKGKTRKNFEDIIVMIENWLKSDSSICEIKGRTTK